MMRSNSAAVLLALCALPALAQEGGYGGGGAGSGGGGIKWGLNVEQAIDEAKKSDRPLMFWVQRSGELQYNKE